MTDRSNVLWLMAAFPCSASRRYRYIIMAAAGRFIHRVRHAFRGQPVGQLQYGWSRRDEGPCLLRRGTAARVMLRARDDGLLADVQARTNGAKDLHAAVSRRDVPGRHRDEEQSALRALPSGGLSFGFVAMSGSDRHSGSKHQVHFDLVRERLDR
jgi:hypothetical protein